MNQRKQITVPPRTMQLYDRQKRRLYVNSDERARFLAVARKAKGPVGTLALTLLYTGCRVSEGLELTAASVQLEGQLIAFRSLKKRHGAVVIREVPIPTELVAWLEQEHHISALQRAGIAPHHQLWPISRKTAWHHLKMLMRAAEISGLQATAKGLRHGFGVHAIRAGIQLNMLQKWMGHASMSTTAIYANATGREELELARRMW